MTSMGCIPISLDVMKMKNATDLIAAQWQVTKEK